MAHLLRRLRGAADELPGGLWQASGELRARARRQLLANNRRGYVLVVEFAVGCAVRRFLSTFQRALRLGAFAARASGGGGSTWRASPPSYCCKPAGATWHVRCVAGRAAFASRRPPPGLCSASSSRLAGSPTPGRSLRGSKCEEAGCACGSIRCLLHVRLANRAFKSVVV